MIEFNQEICSNLNSALRREWLETNGLGGFASSTITGLNTRRYHGLLVAATKPPVGREVLLSKLEETLLIDGQPFDLSCNRYRGVVHPQGFRYLTDFRLDPFPIFTYDIEGIVIEKTVFMVYGENTTVVQYELKTTDRSQPSNSLRLEIRPLIAFRDYHSTTHANGGLNAAVEQAPELAAVAPYPGLPTLYLAHNAMELQKTGDWYRNFEYDIERERGLDFTEDLFNHFILRFDLLSNPVRDQAPPGCGAVFSPERRICPDSYCRERPIHCCPGRQEDHHRRLSLVQRLGTRHYDFPTRPLPAHWKA